MIINRTYRGHILRIAFGITMLGLLGMLMVGPAVAISMDETLKGLIDTVAPEYYNPYSVPFLRSEK